MSRLNTLRVRSLNVPVKERAFARIAMWLAVATTDPKNWYYSVFPRSLLKYFKKMLGCNLEHQLSTLSGKELTDE